MKYYSNRAPTWKEVLIKDMTQWIHNLETGIFKPSNVIDNMEHKVNIYRMIHKKKEVIKNG